MSPRPSSSVSPRRRALHERTPSQANERSPIRSVKETEDLDFYSRTPYPTKPTQVLLPRPGIGQGYAIHGAYGVSDVSLASTDTDHTATGPADENRDLNASISNTWEFSSSVDLGHSSQVWDHDPQSSQSSFPTPLLPSDSTDELDDTTYNDKNVARFQDIDSDLQSERYESEIGDLPEDGEEEEEGDDDDDGVIALPPPVPATVKAVSPNSSPRTGPADDLLPSDNYVTYDHTSSPNVVPIGAPSSPNFVSLASSSPNLVAFGSSSPNIMATGRSNSSASSSNSLGTVIRTYNATAGWPGPSSEAVSSQPASFTSSPPEQLLREYQSASSLALSAGETQLSRSRTTSTGSGLSERDSQFAVESASAIQYAQIRAPSSSGSYAESWNPSSQIRRPARTMSERSAGRWNPTLSTVPWQSPEDQMRNNLSITPSNDAVSGEKEGLGLVSASQSNATIWPVDESDEQLDRLTNLPRSTLRHIPSSLIGSTESRPGSSSSNSIIMNMLPNWVRLYYRSNGQLVQNSSLSILDSSRPSTAASQATSAVRYVSQTPANLSRPRTRPREEAKPPRLLTDHPADPRTHWRQGQQEQSADISFPRPVAKAWSPHLHPDKGHPNPRYTWTAPSLDSREEPFFGRRNVQIYCFCLGFLLPFAWVVAAFLPLPPQISGEEEMVAAPGAKFRIQEHEKRRHQNARWWRNVNRVMIPVGATIIAIIVTLSVVGTTVGFR